MCIAQPQQLLDCIVFDAGGVKTPHFPNLQRFLALDLRAAAPPLAPSRRVYASRNQRNLRTQLVMIRATRTRTRMLRIRVLQVQCGDVTARFD